MWTHLKSFAESVDLMSNFFLDRVSQLFQQQKKTKKKRQRLPLQINKGGIKSTKRKTSSSAWAQADDGETGVKVGDRGEGVSGIRKNGGAVIQKGRAETAADNAASQRCRIWAKKRGRKGEIGETFELKGADRVKARRARDGG